MPRYAALIYEPAETAGQGTEEDWAKIMAEYTEFGATAGAAGVVAGGEALQPPSTATTIHVKGGSKGGDVVTAVVDVGLQQQSAPLAGIGLWVGCVRLHGARRHHDA